MRLEPQNGSWIAFLAGASSILGSFFFLFGGFFLTIVTAPLAIVLGILYRDADDVEGSVDPGRLALAGAGLGVLALAVTVAWIVSAFSQLE